MSPRRAAGLGRVGNDPAHRRPCRCSSPAWRPQRCAWKPANLNVAEFGVTKRSFCRSPGDILGPSSDERRWAVGAPAKTDELDPLMDAVQVAKLLGVSLSWLAKSRLN